MPPTLISIQGHAKVQARAERAALQLDISDSGYEKNTVARNVTSTVSQVQTALETLCSRLSNGEISPDAPVAFFSVASLSTSKEDEYDQENHTRTGKVIQSATSRVDVHFRDFQKLGEMVVEFSTVPYVNLAGINWTLTDDREAVLQDEARVKALRQAIQRARAYAQVIGRESVTPVKIEDRTEFYPVPRLMQTKRMAAEAPTFGIGVGIDFDPQIIDVSVSLDVEFQAE